MHLTAAGDGIYELCKDGIDGEESGENPPVTPFVTLLLLWTTVYSGARREGQGTTLGGLVATAGAVGSAALMNQVVADFSNTLAVSTAVSLAGALAMGRWGSVSGVTLVATGAASAVAMGSLLDTPKPPSAANDYQNAINGGLWSPFARHHHYESQFERATRVLDRMVLPPAANVPMVDSGVSLVDGAVNSALEVAANAVVAFAERITSAEHKTRELHGARASPDYRD